MNKKLPHDHGTLNSMNCQSILEQDEFEIVSDVFRQLGDPSRLRIFWLLCHCEECVINIAALMNMSSPAVSHHLKLLKVHGLITGRRDGKEVYYKAADTHQVQSLHEAVEKLISIHCPIQL